MIKLTRFAIASRATMAVDCRRVSTPFRWSIDPRFAQVRIRASMDDRPGPSDWFNHGLDGYGPGEIREVSETAPVGWLAFSGTAAGAALTGSATIRIAHNGAVYLHHSANDLLTAGAAIDAVDMAVGDDVERYLPAAFTYAGPFGSLHYDAVSNDGTVATADIVGGDTVQVTGVSAGAATVTITATAPHGGQATATMHVTVR